MTLRQLQQRRPFISVIGENEGLAEKGEEKKARSCPYFPSVVLLSLHFYSGEIVVLVCRRGKIGIYFLGVAWSEIANLSLPLQSDGRRRSSVTYCALP